MNFFLAQSGKKVNILKRIGTKEIFFWGGIYSFLTRVSEILLSEDDVKR